jgi:nicotinamide phosphoribosyltransferase
MKTFNPILDTDSYKVSHFAAYPKDLTNMIAYIEPRLDDGEYLKFFGLQSLVMDLANNPITLDHVAEAKKMFQLHFGRDDVFNEEGWLYIVEKYQGSLPIRISALPEGTTIRGKNLMIKIESLDPKCAWLVPYLETYLERIWADITVATKSWRIKKSIHHYLVKTANNPDETLPFMLHDFGARGVTSQEQAARMGLAHLANFLGSDTTQALVLARDYYKSECAGFSIPAMEHSTVISWGKNREKEAYQNFIRTWGKPGSVIAIVADSYDIDYAVEHILGKELRDEIIKNGTKLMIRPDSGNPATMVVKTLRQLEAAFGLDVATKHGYKILNNVGVVQGDGMNEKTLVEVLDAVVGAGYCVSNVVFGMGGGLLQKMDRDTFKFAFKPCLVADSKGVRGVFKSPKDDPGKRSKSGDLDVIQVFNQGLITIDRLTDDRPHPSQLVTYFEHGNVSVDYTLDKIRSIA